MVYFKGCPRCKGDMHLNRDMYGQYKECLQCGYMLDVEKAESRFAAQVAREKEKVA